MGYDLLQAVCCGFTHHRVRHVAGFGVRMLSNRFKVHRQSQDGALPASVCVCCEITHHKPYDLIRGSACACCEFTHHREYDLFWPSACVCCEITRHREGTICYGHRRVYDASSHIICCEHRRVYSARGYDLLRVSTSACCETTH